MILKKHPEERVTNCTTKILSLRISPEDAALIYEFIKPVISILQMIWNQTVNEHLSLEILSQHKKEIQQIINNEKRKIQTNATKQEIFKDQNTGQTFINDSIDELSTRISDLLQKIKQSIPINFEEEAKRVIRNFLYEEINKNRQTVMTATKNKPVFERLYNQIFKKKITDTRIDQEVIDRLIEYFYETVEDLR